MRLLCLLTIFIVSCKTNSPVNEEKEIRNLLDSIIAADNRSDIRKVLACYTNDAVLMPANKPIAMSNTGHVNTHWGIGAPIL